jgi:hypothetical protein
MLEKHPPPSAGALRARDSRARLKQGVRTFRVRAHERRLAAALRRPQPGLPDELTPEMIETMLADVVGTFITRWIGPAKK